MFFDQITSLSPLAIHEETGGILRFIVYLLCQSGLGTCTKLWQRFSVCSVISSLLYSYLGACDQVLARELWGQVILVTPDLAVKVTAITIRGHDCTLPYLPASCCQQTVCKTEASRAWDSLPGKETLLTSLDHDMNRK